MKIRTLHTALRRSLIPMLLAAALYAPLARATDGNPPEYMSYQGFLTDANGNILGNTNTGPKNYDVIFRIWDSQTGGSKVSTEEQTVTVDKGYFSVLLGEGSSYGSETQLIPISRVFTNSVNASDRFMEMTVRGIGANSSDVTILPRLRLLSSPYAFLARNAVNATYLVNSGNGQVVNVTTTNVGINQANPASALDVNGTITATGLNVSGNSTMQGLTVTNAVSAGAINASGAASAGSVQAGSIQVTNGLSAATVTASGAISAASVQAGSVQVTNAISAAAVTVSGAASVGSIQVTNSLSAGTVNVTGDVKMNTGANSLFGVGGDEDLRIVRGVINADGSIGAGTGLTCAKMSYSGGDVGFMITFAKAFSAPPVVVDTGMNRYIPIILNVTPNSFQVKFYCEGYNCSLLQASHFIAVGPR